MYDFSFVDDLASSAPVPGGGGASAYVGAIASALASMVGNLTVGKKKYAAVEDEMRSSLAHLESYRVRLEKLVEEDAQAFLPLAQAYRMPKETSEEAALKEAALQKALAGACEVPLEIMRQCVCVAEECGGLARKGSRLAVSDAVAAAILAAAAARAASLNVFVNAESMADCEQAKLYCGEAYSLLDRADACARDVQEYVSDEIA